MKLGGNS